MTSRVLLRNGKTLLVKTPVIKDAKAMVELMKLVDLESPFLAREVGEFETTVDREREIIKSVLNSPAVVWFCGEYDGRLVAQSSVNPVRKGARFKHRAELGIVIEKAYWGLGIGGKLIEACIDWCKDNRIEQLELDVVHTNTRAIELYKSFGFVEVSRIPNAIKYRDGTYVDDIRMLLNLKD